MTEIEKLHDIRNVLECLMTNVAIDTNKVMSKLRRKADSHLREILVHLRNKVTENIKDILIIIEK